MTDTTNSFPPNDYFARVAEEWDELRRVFFTEAMRDDAIKRANLPETAVVADVGTGTGFVLQGLIHHATRLVGFDASPEMLTVARRHFAHHPHVEFHLAEGHHLPVPDHTFDAVFANMYLHHTPNPLAAIQEMTRILKPGGKLIITDLDSHDQAWMQDEMADTWLGFERDQIRAWYQTAGLTNIIIDCAAGTCDCSHQEKNIALSIFVAIGQRPH
ncbi:MAG: class I SAM-dependent methyltransferase [Chloroflexi bacterium]|nr:MAG: class I SAM-dependent methyltransferase [Chloroflexota bacterium]